MNTVSTLRKMLAIIEMRGDTATAVSLSALALNDLFQAGIKAELTATGTHVAQVMGLPLDVPTSTMYDIKVSVKRKHFMTYQIHDYDLFYSEDTQQWESST